MAQLQALRLHRGGSAGPPDGAGAQDTSRGTLDTLYERHAANIYTYLLARTASAEDAADLTQQVFLHSHDLLPRTPAKSTYMAHGSRVASQTIGGFSVAINRIAAGPRHITITYTVGEPSWWSQGLGRPTLGAPLLIDARGRRFPPVSDVGVASTRTSGTRTARFDATGLGRHGGLSRFQLQFAPIELTTPVEALPSNLQATVGVVPAVSRTGTRTVKVVPVAPRGAPIILIHSYGPFTFQVTIPSTRHSHSGPSSSPCAPSSRTCR